MNRKLIRKWLAISMAGVFLAFFCACEEHEHTYAEGWSFDDDFHWRVATCDDRKGEKDFVSIHNMVDGVCTLCGYEDPDYVDKSEEPGKGEDESKEDPNPGTEDPNEDPELPDDDPSTAERPKPPEESKDPENPDDPKDDPDDPLGDEYYDSFFVPENEFTRGESFTQDGFRFSELLKEGKLLGFSVSASSEKSGEITIPKTYNDQPVIMVEKDGFSECGALEKVTLPEGLLYIGEGAFKGCASLRTVVLPSSVWLICREAFFGCRLLSDISFPEGVREIRYAAFEGDAISKLSIPNSLHTIASRAFFGNRLGEVTFGTGVKNVGGQAFYGCSVGRVNISDLKAFCDISFVYGNSNPLSGRGNLYLNGKLITKLEIPEGCGVNKYSFYGCSSIEEVTIPSSAGRIGEGAFMYCSNLKTVDFKEGAYELDSFSFGYNNNLNELILPNSLKTIRVNAVYCCTNLSKVVFGKGLSLLEMDAFTQISSSAQFYYRGSAAEWGKIVKNSSWTRNPSRITYDYKD